MTCNYFDFRKLTDKLFYGVALTEEHLNNATEQIRKYLADGGATPVTNALGIGVQFEEREGKVVRERIVYTEGRYKNTELHISEIEDIGHYLKHGCLYGRCGCPAC